jgi:hypothetical protein
MEHRLKEGYIIKDDHIKRVKKLLKKKTIRLTCKIWTNEVECEVVNIRKYLNRWSTDNNQKYCYEVDIKADLKNANLPSWYVNRNKRSLNDRIRLWKNEQLLLDELVYFGINELCISKVQYV